MPKRSPQRQAYRLQELSRWRQHLDIPLNLDPRYFPVSDKLAATMVVNLREQEPEAAIRLAGACLRACWLEERNISDRETLVRIAEENQLDGDVLLAASDDTQKIIAEDSKKAVERGIFGAPSYVVGEHIFWGQDRLDFLDWALAGDS